MPWTNVTSGEEINRCVILARCGRFTVTELCEQFGISRETGYKHLERCAALGLAGLLAAAQPPAAPLAAAHRRSGRGTHSRGAPGKENCGLPTKTPSPPPPRANRSSGQSPPAPTTRATHPRRRPEPPTRADDQSHPPAAADPTDRAADTAQAASRLTTCQPTHTSLPEKTLKTLF